MRRASTGASTSRRPWARRCVAAAGGDVRFAGTAGSSGLTISIRTERRLRHLVPPPLVARRCAPGRSVSAGERIGAVGTTGTRSATAPHLHFGVRDAGNRHGYHDPLGLPARAARAAPSPAPAGARPGSARPSPAAPAARAAARPRRRARPRAASGRARPAPTPRPPRRCRRRAVHRAGTRRSCGPPRARASRRPRPGLRRLARPAAGRLAAPARRAAASASDARAPSSAETARRGSHARRRPRARRTATSRGDGPDLGWALACGGLLLAAAVLGLTATADGAEVRRARAVPRSRRARGQRSRAGRVDGDAVLRHHADLLRQRRAASRARLHDDRRRRSRSAHAPARRGRLLPHGHRRARRAGRAGGREARHHAARAGRPQRGDGSRSSRRGSTSRTTSSSAPPIRSTWRRSPRWSSGSTTTGTSTPAPTRAGTARAAPTSRPTPSSRTATAARSTRSSSRCEKEDNWFFRLSAFQEPLEQLYADRPDFVMPQNRYNEALSFIKSGLRDLSLVARPAEVGRAGAVGRRRR